MAADSENPIDDFPWPKESDRVFAQRPKAKPSQSTGSLEFDEILESMRPDPDYYYRAGYYEAAQVLATELSESEHSDLYYPMLYCFRHYVELSLKSLLKSYAKLVDEEVRGNFVKTHALMKLWNEVNRVMDKAAREDRKDDGTLKVVERSLNDLHQVDCSSQTFRYATDTSGKTMQERLAPVDLAQFTTTMKSLHSFFEGCQAQADVWQEWKDEAEAIARSEMPDESYS